MTAAVAAMVLEWVAKARGWLLAAGAGLVVLFTVYARGRRSARQEAALDDATEALRRREVRDAVDRDVAGDAGAADRLREWRRD